MISLNAILTKTYAVPQPAAAATPAASARSAAEQLRPAEVQGDRFQPGQYWRNRAVGDKGAAAAPGCRCGSCALCAVRAYGSQDTMAFAAAGVAENEQESQPAASGIEAEAEAGEQQTGAVKDESSEAVQTNAVRANGVDGEPLDQEEVAQLLELKKADAAVRAHEQAHLAAAGGLAKGGASFVYQKGPDGREYAVGGEVQIDTSRGATPEETIARMTRVRAAALAPANPSSQDRKVARSASAAMSEARLDLHVAARGGKEQQNGGVEEAASGQGDEAARDNLAAAPSLRKSDIAARAASRYLARAQGPGAIHLAV